MEKNLSLTIRCCWKPGSEKLTLMFDVEGLYMMVANLYGREKYAITPSLMEQVENLKKKQ